MKLLKRLLDLFSHLMHLERNVFYHYFAELFESYQYALINDKIQPDMIYFAGCKLLVVL